MLLIIFYQHNQLSFTHVRTTPSLLNAIEHPIHTDKREIDLLYQAILFLIIEKFSEEIKSTFHAHEKFLLRGLSCTNRIALNTMEDIQGFQRKRNKKEPTLRVGS
jgi:hypothetical protein